MTPQEIFDKATSATLKQGVQCYSEDYDQCLYRSEINGEVRRCWAGQLFNDHPETDEFNVADLFVISKRSSILQDNGIDPEEHVYNDKSVFDMMIEGQKIHDNHQPENWPQRYKEMAERFNLSAAVCEPYLN